MAKTQPVERSSGGKSSATAWVSLAGFAAAIAFFNIHAFGGSGLIMAEAPATGTTFVTECMEASLLWREGSPGWYQAATIEERAALRRSCNAAFNRGKPTDAMTAVREGRATVRSATETARAGSPG